jgi:hypothetical protein
MTLAPRPAPAPDRAVPAVPADARREDAGLDRTKNLRVGGLDASSGTVLLFA